MITIIDYKAGNLTSVARALQAVGLDSRITADPDAVFHAERIIFPGVGAAGAAMRALTQSGLDEALREVVRLGRPVLGICIGCQIILDRSEENQTLCLGLIPGVVKAFPRPLFDRDGQTLKVPHMGWNEVRFLKPHPLFQGQTPGAEFYFVHGFYPRPANRDDVLAVSDHGLEFPAVIGRDNLMAVQFHTEKSGRPGLLLLKNFSAWRP